MWALALLLLFSLGASSVLGGVVEVRQAAFLLGQRQPQAAEELLRRELRAAPRDALSHQVLACSFLARGQLDSSLAYYTRAVRLDSSMAEAYNGLGIVYTYGHQYDRAARAFARAIDLDAGQPAFFYNAGVVSEHLARLDEACQEFGAAVQLDPQNAETQRALGAVLMALARPREALEHYTEACRLAPEETANWYGAAKAHGRLEQDSLAIRCLERARDLGQDEAEVFYQLGLLYRKAGREEASEDALARFRRAKAEASKQARRIELKMTDPDPARNQYDLGALCARHGWPAAASVRIYRAKGLGLTPKELALPLLTTGPLDPARMERLASLEAMQHQEYRLAASYLRAAVRLAPRDALNHRNLGLALHFLQRDDEAIGAYREAIRLDPHMAPAYNDLALLLAKERRQSQEAIQLLRQAIEVAPREKVYPYNLGLIHLGQRQYAEAIQQFGRAIELDSTSAAAYHGLGQALAKQGRLAEAEGRLKKAIEINPGYAKVHEEVAFMPPDVE